MPRIKSSIFMESAKTVPTSHALHEAGLVVVSITLTESTLPPAPRMVPVFRPSGYASKRSVSPTASSRLPETSGVIAGVLVPRKNFV